MISSGQLKQRIRIERPVHAKGSMGGTATTWTVVAEARAEIRPVTGREVSGVNQLVGELTARCVMRYQPGIDETMRVVDRDTGTVYAIVGPPINIKMANRRLELLLSNGLLSES